MRFEHYGMARARSSASSSGLAPSVAFFWETGGGGVLWAATNFGVYFSLEFSRDYASRSSLEKVELQIYSPCCAATVIRHHGRREGVSSCSVCAGDVWGPDQFRYTSPAGSSPPINFKLQAEALVLLEPLAAALVLDALQDRFAQLFSTVAAIRNEPRVRLPGVRPANAPLSLDDRSTIEACKHASGKL